VAGEKRTADGEYSTGNGGRASGPQPSLCSSYTEEGGRWGGGRGTAAAAYGAGRRNSMSARHVCDS